MLEFSQGENKLRKQIIRFAPLQTAKVMALLYLLISLPLVLLMFLAMSFAPGPKPAMGVMLILMPIFYAVFGFIFTIIGAWAYNFVASIIGGIELPCGQE